MAVNTNTTLTDVVNSALVTIGDTPITSLDDDTNAKSVCARLVVEQCIREVQCHHSACWEELVAEAELTGVSDESDDSSATTDDEEDGGNVFGEHIYEMPDGWLSINGVFAKDGRYVGWRILGGTLRTTQKAKFVRYVKFSDDPSEWSAELKNCIITLLAAKLLAGIVKDYTASKQMVEAFWANDFPRWVNNRANNSQRKRRGYDREISRYYFGNERVPPLTNSSEY